MLFIELYIIECDLKNQRFWCDDRPQILPVESPNLLYILTALLQWLWAQQVTCYRTSVLICEYQLLQDLVDNGKTPFPKPASRKASMSTSIHFNGFSTGMAPLNRKWKGKVKSDPSATEEGLQKEEGVRWQGLHIHVCSGLCDKTQ